MTPDDAPEPTLTSLAEPCAQRPIPMPMRDDRPRLNLAALSIDLALQGFGFPTLDPELREAVRVELETQHREQHLERLRTCCSRSRQPRCIVDPVSQGYVVQPNPRNRPRANKRRPFAYRI